MKTITLWTSLLIIGFMTFPALAERTTVVFNNDWLFAKDSPDGAQDVAFDDGQWQKVRLPHDWAISGPFDPKGNPNTGKLPWQGKGWYRKHFDVKAEDAGKCVYFLFDGVMAMPTVYINGQKAGGWDYGYNSFWVDATQYIAFGKKNVIAVAVDTTRHGSRWYPGPAFIAKCR
jgi:beta-galactosidase